MGFRRRRPLHEELARAAGLELDGGDATRKPGLAADVPDWDGAQRGEAGIHGVARPRNWDAVARAEAPELRGDAVRFVALPDGTLVVEEGVAADGDEAGLTPLADAVEATLRPPYRVEGVRRGVTTWAVAARRLQVVEVPGLDGEEAELVTVRGSRSLTIDGYTRLDPVPALAAAGETQGPEHVVRARRIDGDLWEVEATAL